MKKKYIIYYESEYTTAAGFFHNKTKSTTAHEKEVYFADSKEEALNMFNEYIQNINNNLFSHFFDYGAISYKVLRYDIVEESLTLKEAFEQCSVEEISEISCTKN